MGKLGSSLSISSHVSILDSIDAWKRIIDPRFNPLLAELAQLGGAAIDPALVTRLRRDYEAEDLAIGFELHAARRRARVKFANAEQMLCDLEGVAQSSGSKVAEHKAERFRDRSRIVDLCCGIGGDTMALAKVGQDVSGVDLSPVRAQMAKHNAGVPIETCDVASQSMKNAWIHIDPGRRSGGRRLWRYEDVQPGPDVVEPLLSAAAGAALKLGPGVDWSEIPDNANRECEVIGDRSGLLQAVIWCGDLVRAPGQHTATRLQDALSYSAVPDDFLAVASKPGHFLLIPDPALERARLVAPRVGSRDAFELAAGLGWLTSDEPLEDPWFEEHEILAAMPWRPRKIREWLQAHDGGPVTVRTRAGAIHTDREQSALRGDGLQAYTVFGVREGKRIVCYITAGAAEFSETE